MTLTTLLIRIALAAVILTLIVGFGLKKQKSWLTTYLQSFCGALFFFSGWVKAIDPLGTAYKMEQYFAEFESTFSETWFSFISPMFPFLSEYSIVFSVAMIVFEIVLAIMLLLGTRPKWTAWAFFLLVLFFTALTGFTYLTGFVPGDANFFEFSKWGEFVKTNMKVQDCGCFGDFIKLEPKTSFLKDVFLLIPALYFIWKHDTMHVLFTEKIRKIALGVSTVGLVVYCLSNFVTDLPHTDFRPFKIGTDVAGIKEAETEAEANVQVTHFVMKNRETGEVQNVAYNDYMSNFEKYPKDKFETIDQLKTEPTIAKTKISDFEVTTFEGDEVSDVYLHNDKYHFMLVSHKIKYKVKTSEKMVVDTIVVVDSLFNEAGELDSLVEKVNIVESRKTVNEYIWNPSYLADVDKLKPFIESALNDGHEVSLVAGGLGQEGGDDLVRQIGLDIPVYSADDILLKTIVRSNPGIVLWKDGKIVYKWHKRKLPAYDEVKSKFLK